MRILLRITLLGIFSVAGLALAVSVVLQLSPTASDAAVPALAADAVVEPIVVTVPSASPPVPAEIPSPALAAPVRDMQDEWDAGLSRITASYLPAITRQFELLEQAQLAAQRLQEQTQRAADELERRNQEPTPPGASPLPTPVRPSAPASSGAAVAPEVQHDVEQDRYSVTAPNSDIREVLKTLSDATGLNILATPSVTGTVYVSLSNVSLEEALPAILKSSGFSSRREGNFVYVGTVEEIANLATANDRVGTRVFQPNYITADELQKLLTPMLTKNDIGVIAVSAAPEVGIASNKDAVGGNSYAGGEVVLVRDFESVLRQMEEVFIEVDRMPSQVAIEAMILSVRLDDNDTLGVNFELLRDKEHVRLTSGPFGTTTSTPTTLPAGQIPAAALTALNSSEGLKIALLDESIFALIQALETIGDTNVIASPHVMCLNKQRAEILIGSKLGYNSTTVTETASTQSVEFLEVGTHLKLRPFISADGMVRLEVHPELSTGNVRVVQGLSLPDKEVTEVTTNVMCRSGGTVVIGGLIREDLVTSSTQIPVLGNLPLLGALFRQRSEDTERREIIVLLTPRIVGEHDMYAEADQAATQTRDRRNAFFDKMQPTNKRRIGEHYHRLAISAWAAGDALVTLRYANLAIHYDPLLQGAIDLRQQVLSAYPDLESGVHEHLREGLRPLEVPHRDYSAETGWPWRELDPAHHTPGQYLPGDPGTSGRVHTLFTDSAHPESQPPANEPRRLKSP